MVPIEHRVVSGSVAFTRFGAQHAEFDASP